MKEIDIDEWIDMRNRKSDEIYAFIERAETELPDPLNSRERAVIYAILFQMWIDREQTK